MISPTLKKILKLQLKSVSVVADKSDNKIEKNLQLFD